MDWCKEFKISIDDYTLNIVNDRSNIRTKYYVNKYDKSKTLLIKGILNTQNYSVDYLKHNRYHRDENLPARIEVCNGKLILCLYFKNGNLHREDGPCSYRLNNYTNSIIECWCINNKFNRFDGPAYIYTNNGTISDESYYINDYRFSNKEEYYKLINNIKNDNTRILNKNTKERRIKLIKFIAEHFGSQKLLNKCDSLMVLKKLER